VTSSIASAARRALERAAGRRARDLVDGGHCGVPARAVLGGRQQQLAQRRRILDVVLEAGGPRVTRVDERYREGPILAGGGASIRPVSTRAQALRR
jgi:hypothetical protein